MMIVNMNCTINSAPLARHNQIFRKSTFQLTLFSLGQLLFPIVTFKRHNNRENRLALTFKGESSLVYGATRLAVDKKAIDFL